MTRSRASIACALAAALWMTAGPALVAQDRDSGRDSRVPPPTPTAALDATEDYLIGPEDVLDIQVWKDPDLTKTIQVRPDGKISLPLVNDVQAAGLSPMQLRATLTKGYSQFMTNPEISVIVREVHSLKVSVLGAVRTPGRFDLRSQATVLDALAMAGGFTDYAKRDRIAVHRRNGAIVPFDYLKVLDTVVPGVVSKDNVVLLPGDIIIVP
jgi:polysaccharide export outer membrane protein